MATVTAHRSLEALEQAVGANMGRRTQPGLHDRLDWFHFLLRYTPPDGEPAFVHVAGENGGLVLPLAVDGARGRALANWYSLSWGPIVWGEHAGLLKYAITKLGMITLEHLDEAHAQDLALASIAAGWRVEDRPGKAHWVAHVDGLNFADFWAARPSRLRNTVARKRTKAGLEISISRIFDPEAWAAYEDVYADSWKPEEGSAAFLRALAEAEGGAGTLRLGIARAGGQAVAAQLWLVENGQATIHKLAYRADKRDLSPGSILSAAMFEHVLTRDAPRLVSYGLGDEPYKADWMDERRVTRRLILRNPRHPVGALSLAKAALRRLVKREPAV